MITGIRLKSVGIRIMLFASLLLPGCGGGTGGSGTGGSGTGGSGTSALSGADNQSKTVTVVDQQQLLLDESVGGLAIGGASTEKLAQTITAGVTGELIAVRLPVACPTGDLTLQVQGVKDNKPDGAVLTSQIVPGTTLPTSLFTFTTLTFSSPVHFSAGDAFAVVLTSNGECAIAQSPVGDLYPFGSGYFDALPNPPGWEPLTAGQGQNSLRYDLPFQTMMDVDVIHVSIDIKPGGLPNSINPLSLGVIPVAILSTATFDVTTINPMTVRFGKIGTNAPAVSSAKEDVNGDGLTDLVFHFDTQATGIQCGDISASLTGETFSGQKIEGADSIKTVGCK